MVALAAEHMEGLSSWALPSSAASSPHSWVIPSPGSEGRAAHSPQSRRPSLSSTAVSARQLQEVTVSSLRAACDQHLMVLIYIRQSFLSARPHAKHITWTISFTLPDSL